jgi:hypothetical protein
MTCCHGLYVIYGIKISAEELNELLKKFEWYFINDSYSEELIYDKLLENHEELADDITSENYDELVDDITSENYDELVDDIIIEKPVNDLLVTLRKNCIDSLEDIILENCDGYNMGIHEMDGHNSKFFMIGFLVESDNYSDNYKMKSISTKDINDTQKYHKYFKKYSDNEPQIHAVIGGCSCCS